MESKILKYLVLGCLALGLKNASAMSTVNEELMPGSCSHMSKNPRCWEDQNQMPPRPRMCPIKDSCSVIKSVHQDSSGQFHCKGVNGNSFSCEKVVEQFGDKLEGVAVLVTTPYVDGCHILGGCGPKACVPSYGTASLDQSCQ